jgi:CBS-domain-containing membrane protein
MATLQTPKTSAAWLAPVMAALVAGCGGGLTIYLLAQVQAWTSLLMLAPAFGASCVLVFALPDSPLAHPRNVIGGHLVSTAVGLAALAILGHGPLAMGVGVGIAIVAMMLTRTLHPPAGGNPVMVILGGASVSFLFKPILLGAVVIVLIGAAYHHLVAGRRYPKTWRY